MFQGFKSLTLVSSTTQQFVASVSSEHTYSEAIGRALIGYFQRSMDFGIVAHISPVCVLDKGIMVCNLFFLQDTDADAEC